MGRSIWTSDSGERPMVIVRLPVLASGRATLPESMLEEATGQGIGTEPPSVTLAPFCTLTGRPGAILAPFTNVPFFAPRSSSRKPSARCVRRQWWEETAASGTTRSQSLPRPINHSVFGLKSSLDIKRYSGLLTLEHGSATDENSSAKKYKKAKITQINGRQPGAWYSVASKYSSSGRVLDRKSTRLNSSH